MQITAKASMTSRLILVRNNNALTPGMRLRTYGKRPAPPPAAVGPADGQLGRFTPFDLFVRRTQGATETS